MPGSDLDDFLDKLLNDGAGELDDSDVADSDVADLAGQFADNHIKTYIDIPNDNHCLFWSVAIAVMLNAINRQHFIESFKQLFGLQYVEYAELIEALLHEYALHRDFDKSVLLNNFGFKFLMLTLRGKVADAILTGSYNDFLPDDKTAIEYADFIRDPASWAGELEIRVLSDLLKVKIQLFNINDQLEGVYGIEHQGDLMVVIKKTSADGKELVENHFCCEQIDIFKPADQVELAMLPEQSVLQRRATAPARLLRSLPLVKAGGRYESYVKWPSTFNLSYGKNHHCEINGDAIHAELGKYEHTVRNALRITDNILLSESGDPKNTVYARIGFVLSNGKYHPGKQNPSPGKQYVSFNVVAKTSDKTKTPTPSAYCDLRGALGLPSGKEKLTTQVAKTDYRKIMIGLVGSAESKMKAQHNGLPDGYKSADERNFNNFSAYAHSETALMLYLLSPVGQRWLVEQLQAHVSSELGVRKVANNVKVYAVVLHVHTFRYMCENCAELAYGFMDRQGLFIQVLMKNLQAAGFWFSEKNKAAGLRGTMMVSAESEFAHRKKPTHASDSYVVSDQGNEVGRVATKRDVFDSGIVLHQDNAAACVMDESLRINKANPQRTMFFSSSEAGNHARQGAVRRSHSLGK